MAQLKLASGHPQGLMTLFFSEMWERFCYYGMRVLLTLYLVKSLLKGDAEASLIYGAYTALIYAAPVLGGRLADQYLGYRYAILLGAVLMAIGEFLILGGTEEFMLLGMGALIVGNGYFKANISTIVGKLYQDNDPRRDSGFTIFYIGINIGALLATTVVAYVGEEIGFRWGFGLAGLGMLAGLLIFWAGRKNYAAAPGLDISEAGMKQVGPLKLYQVISLASLALIPLCYVLISQNDLMSYLLTALFVIVAFSLIQGGFKESKVWGQRMIALVIFMLINIVFWACFEQAGTSLTLFADRNVSREIFGWTMPASMTQFFNPAFIILFGSLFSWMWLKLTSIGKNPSIPIKFALGILQLGLGFLVTYIGFNMQLDGFLVPLWTLILLYLLHTTGELFLSPIGLSMVTKLAPKHVAGTAMGGWFLSFAIANFLGGQIAALTGAEGHGDKKEDTAAFNDDTTVKEGLAMIDGLDAEKAFAEWKALEDGASPNISFSAFKDQQSYISFRKALKADQSFTDWKATNETLDDNFKTAKDWLNEKDVWEPLRADLQQVEKWDEEAEKAGSTDDNISFDAWMYFKENFDSFEGKDMKLSDAYEQHRLARQEQGLNKYTNIFVTIGLVLVAFSILIALLNRPLNKLMHGVT